MHAALADTPTYLLQNFQMTTLQDAAALSPNKEAIRARKRTEIGIN
jgi:hypothetical protein